jgi:ketosteroid isomerase-like protein
MTSFNLSRWGEFALLTSLLVLSGCASAPAGRSPADEARGQAEIRRRLDEIVDACEKKDFERLDSYHLYGPKFTKFTPEAAERLDAEAGRKGEHDGLSGAADLVMKIDRLKTDLFGNVAVSTFMLNYSFKTGTNTVQRSARSTMVFVKENGDWKIAHEHLSR